MKSNPCRNRRPYTPLNRPSRFREINPEKNEKRS